MASKATDSPRRYPRALPLHRIILWNASPLTVGSKVVIDGDEAHHALRVKRVATGDEVELLDGKGQRATARVGETSKQGKATWKFVAEVIESHLEPHSEVRLEVLAAAAKGDRLDEMLDSLSQLGVDQFRPLLSDHTIVDPREAKLERLRRAALESTKQCGRAWPIEVGEPVDLQHAMKELEGVFACVADASGSHKIDIPKQTSRVVVFVGPEGGWSPREVEGFRAGHLPFIRCAPHVLRVETAAIAAATMLINHPSLRRYTQS
jgi:16S rRNA (uracil1498-N3)-methyltransferase